MDSVPRTFEEEIIIVIAFWPCHGESVHSTESYQWSQLFMVAMCDVAQPLALLPPAGSIEVLNVKVGVFILLLFASIPDCSQNQTAVSDPLRFLSDF